MREKDEVIEKLEELILELKADASILKIKMKDIEDHSSFDYERGKIEALKWFLKKIKYI